MENSDLIEHLREYYEPEGSKGFNVLDFVYAFGSPLVAITNAKLLWPDFAEFKGMIFLNDHIEIENPNGQIQADIERCLTEAWTKQDIEKSFNIFEVPEYFFGKFAGDTYDDEDEYLADTLIQTWRCKLALDFPSRKFSVEIVPPEENGGDLAIMFYELNS